MDRTRIKTYVRGLDEALGGGLPAGFVVLLCGAPGTMKSSLAFSVLYENARKEGRKCAFFTLEQGKDSLLESMAGLGMADEKAFENLLLMDMGNIRKNLTYLQGRGSWLELFKMYCNNVMRSDKVGLLAVDSLEVLETMAKMQDRRQDLYFLFEWLRDLGPLTILVSETPMDPDPSAPLPDEAYLADGVLEVGMYPDPGLRVERRLRVRKMRGTRHELGYCGLAWDGDGFAISPPISGSR